MQGEIVLGPGVLFTSSLSICFVKSFIYDNITEDIAVN